MCSIFLLLFNYSFFISAIADTGSNNQCGCLHYDSCPNRLRTRCASENDKHEDFYLQNSVSEKDPEVCDKWSLKGFTKELTSSENGTLDTTLFFSPHLFETSIFKVQLRYQSQCSDLDKNSLFYKLDLSHSNKFITVEGASTYFCKKMVKLSFPHIFSGCYQLFIKNMTKSEISGGCMSKPFYIKSAYEKSLLYNLSVTTDAVYKSQRQELVYTSVFGNFSEGLEPDSTEITLKSNVNLSLKDCAGSGNLASKYVMRKGECCHHALHHKSIEPRNTTNCPCKWDNRVTLTCRFNEIPNGNYCVILKIIDPRCETSTLWMKSETGYASCAWGWKIEAIGQTIWQISKEFEPHSDDYTLILCFVFVGIGTSLVVFLFVYLIRTKKKMYFYTGENVTILEKSCFINEDYEILLLYPRDCEGFMQSMRQFRTFLKDSCLTKVYDPWDEEMFDKVAESTETWSLPFIKNKKIKIVILLTECSKMIEETYIDDKCSFTYRDPNILDQVFGQSLKAINQYFATRVDSYQRVFVVRFDETSVGNLSFHLNCATLYNLPHCLEILVQDLQNGNPSSLNQENIKRLRLAIKEYQAFKHQNPNYLTEIVNIDNNNKIVKPII